MGNALDELKKIPVWAWIAGALVVGTFVLLRARAKSSAASSATGVTSQSPTSALPAATGNAIPIEQIQGIDQMLMGISQADSNLQTSVNALGTGLSTVPGATVDLTQFPGAGGTSNTPAPTAVPTVPSGISVAALYQDLLQRAPDASGAAWWGAQNPSSLFQSFVGTNEATALAKANPATFVQHEYAVFGANPDPAGVTYWSDQIASGAMTPAQEAAQFQGSFFGGRTGGKVTAPTMVTA